MGKHNPAEALATALSLPWVWLHVKDYWQQDDGLWDTLRKSCKWIPACHFSYTTELYPRKKTFQYLLTSSILDLDLVYEDTQGRHKKYEGLSIKCFHHMNLQQKQLWNQSGGENKSLQHSTSVLLVLQWTVSITLDYAFWTAFSMFSNCKCHNQ